MIKKGQNCTSQMRLLYSGKKVVLATTVDAADIDDVLPSKRGRKQAAHESTKSITTANKWCIERDINDNGGYTKFPSMPAVRISALPKFKVFVEVAFE
ncbi:hypothetical protein BDZ89DRAFT_1077996 [Hymenopellis radicata]|nr:hypothetical protein BDZ89DRAFT_1077996 [Hymenopellis radicata]